MDHSTINLDRLRKRPLYEGKATISATPGSGCFLDAPGFPSYFLRDLWVNGNHPRGVYQVILEPDGTPHAIFSDAEAWTGDTRKKRLHSLWSPLPVEHPRVQAWMRYVYGYFNTMYLNTDIPENERSNVSNQVSKKNIPGLRTFRDDPRFSDEWRKAERAAIELHNAELRKHYEPMFVPENSAAVSYIRTFYPDHVPNLEWLDNPEGYGSKSNGNWWETEAEQPTPENCKPRSMGPHPLNGTWCQWCGWHKEGT